jgi:hypothetical protein
MTKRTYFQSVSYTRLLKHTFPQTLSNIFLFQLSDNGSGYVHNGDSQPPKQNGSKNGQSSCRHSRKNNQGTTLLLLVGQLLFRGGIIRSIFAVQSCSRRVGLQPFQNILSSSQNILLEILHALLHLPLQDI